jgi:hypothetical protein
MAADPKKIKEVEDKIRDIINLISIFNKEEADAETSKIDDEAAKKLKEELRKLALIVGRL